MGFWVGGRTVGNVVVVAVVRWTDAGGVEIVRAERGVVTELTKQGRSIFLFDDGAEAR